MQSPDDMSRNSGNASVPMRHIRCGCPVNQGHQVKVLVIEDSPLIRTRLVEMIKRIKATELAGCAEDGAMGLEMFRALEPDVVVLDIEMPGLSGFDVLSAIKRERPECVVLVLTAFANDEYRHCCRELGADYFFDKSTEFERAIELLARKSAHEPAHHASAVADSSAHDEESLVLQRIWQSVLLDSKPEAQFDDLVSVAAFICEVPIAILSLATERRHWFKAKVGIEMNEIVRDHTFCDYTIELGTMFVVEDAKADGRFAGHPLVSGPPHLRFYTGLPLKLRGGLIIGTLSVIDVRARKHLAESQTAALECLGRLAVVMFEHRLASELLRHREEDYRTVIQTAHDGFWMADLEGRLLDVNEAYCRLVRYEREHLLKLRIEDLEASESPEQVREHIRRTTAEGPHRFETRHRCSDGSLVDLEVSLNYTAREGGRVFAFFRDITERKRTEQELSRLATAVEHAAEIIVITDLGGTIAYVNPAFEQVTGYSRTEAIGQNPRILKSGEHPREFYSQLWETITSGGVWRGRFINKRKDGTHYEEQATISPVRDSKGRIVNFIAVKQDLTERLKLEVQLRQMQKLESIGQLAAGVAHDFNNLLAVIQGHAQLLLTRLAEQVEAAESLREIVHASERGANLTRQLLMFARKQHVQSRTVDLNEVIEQMAGMFRRLIGENIELEHVLSNERAVVHVGEGMVEQLLVNLVVNSRDAMPKGGRLKIETQCIELGSEFLKEQPGAQPGRYVCLSVTDTGCGIPPEVLPRIFDPFFTTKEAGKGTGLGLATVYGIVNQHGGFIRVETKQNRGTTFRIYLPASAEPVQEASQTARPTASQSEHPVVLLVEDEDAVRFVARIGLEKCGCRVVGARSGVEALEIVARQAVRIDALVTDIQMPGGMTGVELAEQILHLKPGLGVVFVSGYAEPEETNILHRKGVRSLGKPYEIQSLCQTVRDCIREARDVAESRCRE